MKQRKIIHIDMDCFYAAIEIRDNPKLRGKPVAVGGPANSRSVLCTCNYEARRFGVRSAMPSSHAVRLCPELIIVPVNFDKYQEVSHAIQQIFTAYTDIIEPLSLDEAYLDVSGSRLHAGSATLIAQDIRQRIFQSQRLTASAGIASNKMLAKIASAWNKPNGQFVITPNKISEFIYQLPVDKLYGVGKVTTEKLHQLDIRTCGDLQKRSADEMAQWFGSYGEQLHQMAFGVDHREVVTERKRKSLSVESTFQNDFLPHQVPEAIHHGLFGDLKTRLAKSEKTIDDIKTAFVKIKFNDFTSTTIQVTCQRFCALTFQQLFKLKTYNEKRPVRLIGYGVQFYDETPQKRWGQLSFEFD